METRVQEGISVPIPDDKKKEICVPRIYAKKDGLIQTLDENGVPDGNPLKFSEVHAKGHWHRVALVCIVNAKNQILLQQRSQTVPKSPNVWDISAASHVFYGYDSIDTAKKSIVNELGISLAHRTELSDFKYITCFRKEYEYENIIEKQFHDLFLVRLKEDMSADIIFNKDEVMDITWRSLPEIRKMELNEEFFPRTEWIRQINDYLIRG